MKYYKFLTEDNRGEYSGYDYTPYLPKGSEPGEWLPEISIENLKECADGYHACKPAQLLYWINAQLYEVELSGKIIDSDSKSYAQRMRFVRKVETWNEKTAQQFNIWCAEQVIPSEMIEVARRYTNGEATDAELAAAWVAALAAALATALDAALAAARGAELAAAWVAALAAALDTALDEVLDAAWEAATALTAALAAARGAELAAARGAARGAVRGAARAAAWASALAAARGADAALVAARGAQAAKLIDMLRLDP